MGVDQAKNSALSSKKKIAMSQDRKGPEFIQWFGPVVEALKELDGSAKAKDVTDLVVKRQQVSSEDLQALTKTGVPRIYNQIAWARQYLVNSGFVDGSKRGIWALTEKGWRAKLDAKDVLDEVRNGVMRPLAYPVLQALQQLGGSGKPREVSDLVAKNLKIPADLLEITTRDGTPRFHNQVAWARSYLVQTGFVDSSNRGTWVLTDKGRDADLPTESPREAIIQDFREFKKHNQSASEDSDRGIPSELEESSGLLQQEESAASLLEVLRKLTPKGFEEVCGLLLRESGFENVVVSGRSRDGGFDGSGKLEINPFVSLSVHFQCKRYIGSVSRAEVGDFRNSMLGRAEKGIFLTTGTFSADARKEADRVDPKIELVDGEKLVAMFQQHELGVKPRTVFDVDMKFFESFMS